MAKYDPSRLRALRDNIDQYLAREQDEDLKIYEALEQSISKAVTDGLKPVLQDFSQQLNEVLEQQKSK